MEKLKATQKWTIIYELLTKCEVKMAGYWPSSFFACLWTETESLSLNMQKGTRPISSHPDRTSLVNKGFIIWLGKFFCGTWRVVPSGQDSSILPAHGASHIIKWLITAEELKQNKKAKKGPGRVTFEKTKTEGIQVNLKKTGLT